MAARTSHRPRRLSGAKRGLWWPKPLLKASEVKAGESNQTWAEQIRYVVAKEYGMVDLLSPYSPTKPSSK